jgi:hypothetical protein
MANYYISLLSSPLCLSFSLSFFSFKVTKNHAKKSAASSPTTSNKMTWKERQKATREMQYAEKVFGTVNVTVKQFCEDGAAVTAPEAEGVLKKIDQRLADNIRWVYTSDDVDLAVDGSTAVCQERSDVLIKLQDAQTKFNAMVPVLKSSAATLAKDPLTYEPSVFKHALEECCEAGLTISGSSAQKYMDRCKDDEMTRVVDACNQVWAAICEDPNLGVGSMTETCNNISQQICLTSWLHRCTVAKPKATARPRDHQLNLRTSLP